MPDRCVIDAGVITLYFAGDQKTKKRIYEILDGKALGYLCEINIAEFLYNYTREFGWDAAATKVKLIRKEPFRIVGVDENLTTNAASLKSQHPKYSLADCYLLALAKRHNATLLTTDGPLSKSGEVRAILIPVPKS